MLDYLTKAPVDGAQLLLVLVIWWLAAYRIARLIVHDKILGSYPETHWDEEEQANVANEGDRGTGVRRLVDIWLLDEWGNPRGPIKAWLAELLKCPVCVGVWIIAAMIPVWFHAPDWVLWLIVAAAVSGAQSYLSTRVNA